MFNSSTGMSPADLAAVTNNGGAFGNDSSWFLWIIVILALFSGNGWGYGNGGGVQDAYVLNSDFSTLSRQIDSGFANTNNLNTNAFDQVQRQITAIGNGISSLGYDQLNQMNSVQSAIANANYDLRNAIQNSDINNMQNTNVINAGITSLSSQLQQCCCQNRYDSATQFAQLNYNLADQSCQTRRTVEDATRDIITNQDANTRSILDFLTQDKIATLTSENAALKASANNAAQTYEIVSQLKTPTPIPAYTVANPYCNCGCNSCCGC